MDELLYKTERVLFDEEGMQRFKTPQNRVPFSPPKPKNSQSQVTSAEKKLLGDSKPRSEIDAIHKHLGLLPKTFTPILENPDYISYTNRIQTTDDILDHILHNLPLKTDYQREILQEIHARQSKRHNEKFLTLKTAQNYLLTAEEDFLRKKRLREKLCEITN
jgi:hypothetical protein